MARVVLTVAGTALGTVIGGPLGGPIGAAIGGAIGGTIGGVVGGEIDRRLFGRDQRREGPRLDGAPTMSSREGEPIPRVWGRMRVGGQLIWDSYLQEVARTSSQSQGKGSSPKVTTTEYSYLLNFAVALCEGPIDGIGRVWFDGVEVDMLQVQHTVYLGTESQSPDPLIESLDGTGNVPAYRGVAYVVFEGVDVTSLNGRPPQVAIEVFKVPADARLPFTGIALLPGAGDFALDTVAQYSLTRSTGGAEVSRSAINVNQVQDRADALVALDQLERDMPQVETVNLVLGWFFDSTSAASANVRPKVDFDNKATSPGAWTVSGLTRAAADEVTRVDGNPAYGATPDDLSVFRCIQEIKARGLRCIIYPFLFGDLSGYPWRGRIVAATPANAAADVASFMGSATAAQVGAWNGATCPFSGSGWGLRRMALHYARLALAAWGADDRDRLMIVIGSELVGLTTSVDGSDDYPMVDALVTLAGDVRGIVGSEVKITYAADWSEYFGHNLGGGEFRFHLDPLWADSEIDYVAIDNYLPLADINPELADSSDAGEDNRALQYDEGYLRSNIEGGERWDYFYASDADRASRTRTSITDGAYGKPWIFRAKAIRDWLANLHYDRPGAVESVTPTAWTANMKPVVFTEFGCAAIDLAANQPNVFFDPKSTESAFPHFSSGARDDSAKRAFERAFWAEWTQIGGSQWEPDWSCSWNFDLRPYPAFPGLVGTWDDSGNWELGFWWTGRSGAVPLSVLLEVTAAEYGLTLDASNVVGEVDGYAFDSTTSWRDGVEPLLRAFSVDVVDDGTGTLVARSRSLLSRVNLTVDDLAMITDQGSRILIERARESSLPRQVRVTYLSGEDGDYRTAQAAHTLGSGGEGVLDVSIPAAMQHQSARDAAQRIARELFAQRETISNCALGPAQLGVTVGDVLSIDGRDWQVTRLAGGLSRSLEARSVDLEALEPSAASGAGSRVTPPPALAAPALAFLDLPQIDGGVAAHRGYIAAHASPWPVGGLDVYRSPTTDGYALSLTVPFQAIIGETTTTLAAGLSDRWNDQTLGVEVYSGTLTSSTEVQVLAGANALAIETSSGQWEIVQFRDATLTGTRAYTLSRLLRARRGTGGEMVASLSAGARIVLLDARVSAVPMAEADVGLLFNWRYGPIGRPISDASYITTAHRFTGRGLQPFSPVHLRASEVSGDIVLSWVRRSRARFDPLRLTSAPLSEDVEQYRVEVLAGSAVLRTVAVTAPTWTYDAAMQSADGGAATTARVRQIGTGGRLGAAATVSLP